jgi:hypothetical protein
MKPIRFSKHALGYTATRGFNLDVKNPHTQTTATHLLDATLHQILTA